MTFIKNNVKESNSQCYWNQAQTSGEKLSQKFQDSPIKWLDTAHVSFFLRDFFETFFTPSVLKNYVRVSLKMNMKMHFRMLPVDWQVTDTLVLFGFYNNLYTHKVLIFTLKRCLWKSISIPVNNTNVHNTHNLRILCAACLLLEFFLWSFWN